MQTIVTGICVGFRVIKGTGKDASDYGKLHILQVGTKNLDPDLIPIYVNDVENLGFLLTNYSSGALRWINCVCHTEMDGREKVWILGQVLSLNNATIPIQDGA